MYSVIDIPTNVNVPIEKCKTHIKLMETYFYVNRIKE